TPSDRAHAAFVPVGRYPPGRHFKRLATEDFVGEAEEGVEVPLAVLATQGGGVLGDVVLDAPVVVADLDPVELEGVQQAASRPYAGPEGARELPGRPLVPAADLRLVHQVADLAELDLAVLP